MDTAGSSASVASPPASRWSWYCAPVFRGFAGAILIVAALHLVAIMMLVTSLERLAPRTAGRLWQKLRRRVPAEALDFGWSVGAMNLHWIGAVGAVAGAAGIQSRFPGWWPVSWGLLLLAFLLFAGNLLFRAYRHRDFMVLPMVGLIRSDRVCVLDAGCGSGRTTIALSRVLGNGRVTALDQFNADYIDDGGKPCSRAICKFPGCSIAWILQRAIWLHCHFRTAASTAP